MQFFLNKRITIEVRQEIPQMHRFYVLTSAVLFGLIVSLSILINVGVELTSIYEEFIVFFYF